MNLSFVVAIPTAQAMRIVSGSYRLKDSNTDSMPDASAWRANFTQPCMSGIAAGDVLFVVSTRFVSCAVFIPTSPPLGSIQWNLKFVFIALMTSRQQKSLTHKAELGISDERKNLLPEPFNFVDLRPARNDEVSDTNLPVFEKSRGNVFRRSHKRCPNWTIVRHQSGPQIAIQPDRFGRRSGSFAIHLRVVFERRGFLEFVFGQDRFSDTDRFLTRWPAYQPQT